MGGKRYRYILWDLDRTLWDFEYNSRKVLLRLAEEYIPSADHDRFLSSYARANDMLWTDYEAGRIDKETLRKLRFSIPLEESGITDADTVSAMAEAYLEGMLNEDRLCDNALEVLDYMKGLGCRMAVLTNGFSGTQHGKLKRSGIDGYFDAVVISEETGYHKPSPGAFRKGLESIGGKKEEAVMIGDSFTNDIEGAMIFGIDQIYYNPKGLPCDGGPTYSVGNLREILDIVI